ncbi:MAG: dienelactone hydrolase family protein [Candidatus Velamenicoccus archaeovorus]
MCYEPTARPPLPPIAGGAGTAGSEDLVLEASDGNRFMAYAVRSADPEAPGIVVMPDVRGLHPFYRDLAERLAEAGVHATAIDYFGRTAGIGDRGDGFEYRPHVDRTTPDTVALDVAAAVQHLRSAAGGGASRVYTVGFCFGGRRSLNQAAREHGLSGVIGFYPWPQKAGPEDTDAPVELAAGYRCPVLALFGGADKGISRRDVDELERALDAAGVRHEIAVYEGAPHSFFDRAYDEWKSVCDDAWGRLLRFVGSGAAPRG